MNPILIESNSGDGRAYQPKLDGSVWEITSGKDGICGEVLEDLPKWLGIPEAVDAYVRDVETLPMFGFMRQGQALGFFSVKVHNRFTAEAYVLDVKWQRCGFGGKLFWQAEQNLRGQSVMYLTSKTVTPASPNEGYADTRRSYEALGFVPLEVFPALWRPENPCLLLIKSLLPKS